MRDFYLFLREQRTLRSCDCWRVVAFSFPSPPSLKLIRDRFVDLQCRVPQGSLGRNCTPSPRRRPGRPPASPDRFLSHAYDAKSYDAVVFDILKVEPEAIAVRVFDFLIDFR